jgi:hypothetical protein
MFFSFTNSKEKKVFFYVQSQIFSDAQSLKKFLIKIMVRGTKQLKNFPSLKSKSIAEEFADCK